MISSLIIQVKRRKKGTRATEEDVSGNGCTQFVLVLTGYVNNMQIGPLLYFSQ